MGIVAYMFLSVLATKGIVALFSGLLHCRLSLSLYSSLHSGFVSEMGPIFDESLSSLGLKAVEVLCEGTAKRNG